MSDAKQWTIRALVVAGLVMSATSIASAGGAWQGCTKTSASGTWISYPGGYECGSFWLGWGNGGTDRVRWSTYDTGVRRDMYFTYRHLYKQRSAGDTAADHWAYAEGSYSGNVTANQQGTANVEHTVTARAAYNGDDWLEVGSDGGGAMDTIAEKAKFYPEYDATFSSKTVESYMYAGNVYRWRYVMTNPSSAWHSWGNPVRFAHTGGVTEGPGWHSSGRVNNAPGTGPGGNMDLSFNMRPTTTGDYNEDFQMVYEGLSWFGDKWNFSNSNMRTWTRLSRKAPGATDGWDNGPKKKGETVRFQIAGADSWGTGNSYSWDFDGTTAQGWTAGNACTLTQEDANDRLKINITGADPYCHSPGGLAINAGNVKFLTIRMWANGGTNAELFWSSSVGGWGGDRSVDFDIISDSQWHVYQVPLPASWSGTVYQVRLDPVGIGAANGQIVYVDWLRLHHASDGTSAKVSLGTSNNNWDIYNASAMSWDATNNCWYKEYTITGNYPQTYYCAMHFYNNNSQHCDNDGDRKYGDNFRTYEMANTAPTCSNGNYNDELWQADNTPTLQWNYADADSNPQAQYRVQVDDNSDFSSPEVDTGNVSSSDSSHTLEALADGQFYWRVQVQDGYDWSEWSEATAFFIDATAPTDVSMSVDAITLDSITVGGAGTDALSQVSATAGYNYSRDGASDSGPQSTSYTWTDLLPNTQYTMFVTVSDQAVPAPNTAVSAAVSKYTLIEPVDALVLANVTSSSIEVSAANTPSNLAAGDSGLQFVNTTAATDSGWQQDNTPWASTGLTPNTTYTFTGQSRNGDGTTTSEVTGTISTLVADPSFGDNIVCDKTPGPQVYGPGDTFTFGNPAGFGEGTHGGNAFRVAGFRYAWDMDPSYTFTGSEPTWNGDDLVLTPTLGQIGSYYAHFQSVDDQGVATAATLHVGPFVYEEGPLSVTVDQQITQRDPTNVLSVWFDVVFSREVADFADGDITWVGTAADITYAIAGSGTTYTIEVTAVGTPGTLVPTIAAGAAHDSGGRPNVDSTSTDGSVLYTTAPNLTVAGWAVARVHGSAGEYAIALPVAGTPGVESRRGGIQKVVVTFSEAAVPVDGTLDVGDVTVVDDLSNSYTPVSIGFADAGVNLELLFNAGQLPNRRRFTIDITDRFKTAATDLPFAGDGDVEVRSLMGDANGDGVVNLIDVAAAKAGNRSALTNATANLDITADGWIDLIDAAMSRARTGNTAP